MGALAFRRKSSRRGGQGLGMGRGHPQGLNSRESAGGAEKVMAEKKKWLSGAIRHPGALSKAAAQHGKSKLQEAEKESHSSNPSIRARGALGKRFIQHKI